MRAISTAVIGIFSVLLLLSGQQPTTHGSQSQSSAMSMNDMMKGCMAHCQRTKTSMADMSKMMADAEKSNDPTKMRSALEQAQKTLAEMQGHMDSCMSMMRDHMGGMMQKNPKQ